VARFFSACLCVALLGLAAAARAQDIYQDPSEQARYHFGVIRFTPYIAITDLGVDTNVYNETDAANPKHDTTATFGPGVNYWFKLGRAHVAAKSDLTYTWFQEFSDQRSLNTANQATVTVPLSRIVPFIDGKYDEGRRRVSFEIDSRSYSTDSGYGGGLDVRLTGKTTLRFEAHRSFLDFREDEFFAGESLREALNRHTSTTGVSWREALTPLTIFAVKTEYEQDRFTYSPFKDSNGLRIMPGFEFAPAALIGGRVYVGYRRFDAIDPTVPDYSGLVADVAANYRLRATRFDVLFDRDITYSYEVTQPYYVLSNVGLQVLQKITHHWDVQGNVGRQWLSYREVTDVNTPVDRQDRSYVLGGGVAYELTNDIRVGVAVNYYGRTSNTVNFNEYNGLRVGAIFTYGLSTR
jgi:hypothetical protein